ncbi:TrkH family potassium uptake protein [Wenxinia saemankumensis]|nr:TrkH family potassium uptake protein [Wenxinia saemankumensis]
MIDLRPVGYVIGLLVAGLGAAMLAPLAADLVAGNGHWPAFAESAIVTIICGALMALACSNAVGRGLTIRQSFLLTTGIWFVLPLFGALPLILGETALPLVDAYFESVSGVTTTGTTVIEGLDTLPAGILLWRGILQWLGGLGIVIVAMLFLPVMRVGGMQFFAAEGFDTQGKILPRAFDIAWALMYIYIALTMATFLAYWLLGMPAFDAACHAFATVATGGFSTTDASFAAYPGLEQYAAVLGMILASVPFVRLLQLARGEPKSFFRDTQIRAYLTWILIATLLIFAYRALRLGQLDEDTFRNTLFNTVSIFSGTGFGDGDIAAWGAFPMVVFFCVGAIGGCTSSTGCSIKVFRYQILFRAIGAQIRRFHSAHRVVTIRLDGRTVPEGVVDSVILLFTLFILSLGLLTVALSLTELSFYASVTGAWTAIFNIGPAFGPEVASSGAITGFPDTAKWLMIVGMLVGRLEIIAVIVLLLPRFWRG